MGTLTNTENKLNDVFVKQAPKLPENGKKALVEWAPVISLVIGVLTLLAGFQLWHWAHRAADFVNYAKDVCSAYSVSGCGIATASRFSFWLWLSVAVLLVEGTLYLLAYPGLKARAKAGWNYLFYGALVNVAYAVVSLFTDYDKVGHFLGALIGSAIGFYLLFQIRDAYLGKKATTAKK